MNRRVISIVVLFVFCCSVISAAISVRETNIALTSALDGTISAVASVISEPAIALQGVSWEYTDEGIPWRIVFTRSDLSSYLGALSFNSEQKRTWYETLLDQGGSTLVPFRKRAIDYLLEAEYGKGDVILDGTVTIDMENISNLDLLVSGSAWQGCVVPLYLSLIVSGNKSPEGLILEGKIEIIGGDDSKITVYSENLRINGEQVSFSPFEISY